jgi:hypothetical protein
MTVRPNIAGFSLPELHSSIAVADPADAERVFRRAAQVWPCPEEEPASAEVLADLDRIVRGGLAPGSIEVEGEPLVDAVISLATIDRDLDWTDSSDWADEFTGFAQQVSGGEDDVRLLIRYALDQRPLFGTRQADTGSRYGFLSHAEVGRLLDWHEREPGWGVEGHQAFAADFLRWLTGIHRAGRDYWFHTC